MRLLMTKFLSLSLFRSSFNSILSFKFSLSIHHLLMIGLVLLSKDSLSNEASFIGNAYDFSSNELLYTEHHYYVSEVIHKVEYREPNGEVFATKTINYEKSFFSPDFILENKRNGEFISVKKNNQQVILEYKENRQSSIERSKINDSSSLVIDAGFDHFITSNWDALISGNSLSVNYLIPSKGDYYELMLKQVNCDSGNDNSENSEKSFCFSISSSSFFIRIFSNELLLTYSKVNTESNTTTNNYRLTRFKGRTNISDVKGNYQDAYIRYQF